MRNFIEEMEPRLLFSTYLVTETGDGPGLVSEESNGTYWATTLRGAINAANAAGGSNTITVPSGVYSLNDDALGSLEITSAIDLEGGGASSTFINARVLGLTAFIVDQSAGATVTINNVTINDGAGFGYAGGVDLFATSPTSTLNLTNDVITGNNTSGDANISDGGGVSVTGGTLNLTDSTVSDNTVTGSYEQNNAVAAGGGVALTGGTVNILSSTIYGNTATGGTSAGVSPSESPMGGGVANLGGTLNISDSTIAENTAIGGTNLGNAALQGGADGGGVYSGAQTNIKSSTVALNSVQGIGTDGGGIDVGGESGNLSIGDSIVAKNTGGGGDVVFADPFLTPSLGYNLIGASSNGFTATGDQTGTVASPLDPQFTSTTVQNNGGPTLTLLPGAGSPAIDKASNVLALSTDGITPLAADQRGFARIVNGTVDIGAVETALAAPTVTLTAPSDDSSTANTEPTFSGVAGTATGYSPTVTVNIYLGGATTGTLVEALTTTRDSSTGAYSVAATTPLTVGANYTAQASQANSGGTTGFSSANTFSVGAQSTITTNPQSQTVAAGTDVRLTASATGYPAPTVRWFVEVPGGSFTTISGATSTTLDIGAATLAQSGNKYEAVFSNGIGSPATTTAATLTVTPATPVGSLSGVSSTAASSYNLTTLGTSDWAHWGVAGNASTFDHKATGGSLISNVLKVGTGGFGGYVDPTRNVSWTDGTPTLSDADDSGYLYANNATGAGYSFTVPATTSVQTLDVYLGGYSSGSTLTAHLSDKSAADYVVNLSSSGHYNNIVAITYNAASAGQTLTLTYVKSSNINGTGGSSDLIAAWLAGAAVGTAPIVTTNPTSLSVTAGATATFAAAASGTPTPTAQWMVEPAGGSSFSAISGATSTTLNLGSATVAQSGNKYEAVFTNGVGSPATTTSATLIVTAANAAPVVTVNPTSQSVALGHDTTFTAAATGTPTPTVQWMVEPAGSTAFSPISGATSPTLDIGAATLAQSGNKYEAVFSNGIGSPATTTAATLTVTSSTSKGSLSGVSSTAASSYNLTALGTSDWAHWGVNGSSNVFDHKASGGSQISNVKTVGSGSFGGYTDPTRTVSWTDGTPTSTNAGDHGYLWANTGIGAGYAFTVPASTTTHTLYVYLGGYSSGSTLTAHLSDGSAADYVVNLSNSGHYNDIVAITYNAASAGQTLTLTYVKSSNINGTGGSSDLIAAWLT